ncbi:hypothetical protein CMUS01_15954 [Colletotrichum musicola]|uniref:Uncharacterized protein n=1 Tax=Colletotrichum musicola TaxID=2175873 RepID=A0A8H6IS70_9PEZI|nr:hypothetical protein CMUS01_15954 [Colletotrichum musicola]
MVVYLLWKAGQSLELQVSVPGAKHLLLQCWTWRR